VKVLPRRCHVVAVIVLAAAGCARGADQARLQSDVQQRLDEDVKPGLFEVVGMRRQGSAPLAAGVNGAERAVVYYNATLRLTSDYQFGGWDQLGAASLAYALGATEKGLFGLAQDNHAGDLVRAYGSAIYQRTGDAWQLQRAEPSQAIAAPNIEGSAPPSHSKLLIDRLAAMVDVPPPGVPERQDRIIAEELEIASENIERRFKRGENTFTIATGPAGGEYAKFGMSLIGAVNELAPHLKLRARASAGSVDNAWLLSRGEADYAIVQGDVAAAAFSGHEPFDRGRPLGMLRAVGGLFPEAVHVIVSADGPIRDVSQLKAQRVAVGLASSGSRFDAVAVLAAHDLQLRDLHEIADLPLDEALARLKGKRTDAVFVTAAVPIRALQQFAIDPGFRLLSLHADEVDHVAQLRRGLTRITLPPNTYPQQRDPVITVAALALLVTTTDAPAAEVQRVSELLSTRLVRPPTRGEVARASAAGGRDALSIPLLPGLGGRRP
jgi:TRAP transporter TAXI family solute receptor